MLKTRLRQRFFKQFRPTYTYTNTRQKNCHDTATRVWVSVADRYWFCSTETILHCVSVSNQLQQWTNFCTNFSPKEWGSGGRVPPVKKVGDATTPLADWDLWQQQPWCRQRWWYGRGVWRCRDSTTRWLLHCSVPTTSSSCQDQCETHALWSWISAAHWHTHHFTAALQHQQIYIQTICRLHGTTTPVVHTQQQFEYIYRANNDHLRSDKNPAHVHRLCIAVYLKHDGTDETVNTDGTAI